jgi:hypothetical protein
MALVLMLLILQLGSAELLPISETPTQSFQTQKQTKNQREKSSKSIKSQYFEANPGARTSYKGRFHGEMLINPLKPVAQKKQTAKKNSAKRKNTQEDKTPNKPWIEGFYEPQINLGLKGFMTERDLEKEIWKGFRFWCLPLLLLLFKNQTVF